LQNIKNPAHFLMKSLTLKTLQAGLCLSLGLSSSQAASDAEVIKRGKELYEEPGSCVTSHMADGKGQPGSIPPLTGSTWLQDPNQCFCPYCRGINISDLDPLTIESWLA
jgi:hypothetical protein